MNSNRYIRLMKDLNMEEWIVKIETGEDEEK